MDPEAAGRARRATFKKDLADVYTDDEASPPEWVDLRTRIDDGLAAVTAKLATAVERFVSEPDVRVALAARERADRELRTTVGGINELTRRLNLIAPLGRFQRAELDVEELVRPLYRTPRRTASG